jgi:hypothetical protein
MYMCRQGEVEWRVEGKAGIEEVGGVEEGQR